MNVKGGIDLGGTKIQAVVMGPRGKVVGEAKLPTPEEGGPPAVVEKIVEAMREAAAAAGVETDQLAGTGVGSPGAVDAEAGLVAGARNLPDWEEAFPLALALSERLGCPVALGNDVQVAVDGEFALGAGRRNNSLLGVWWGTGVGGGIILDGKPWIGRGAAAEIGHVVVKMGGALCTCGREGCMEAYAGRGAMEIEARRQVKKGRETELFDIMEKRGRTRLQSGIWARALEREDELAVRLIERAVEALGAGVASVVNVLDVEAVVIGGGLGSRLGEPYVERIREAMQPHLFVSDRPPAVRAAALGDLGGAIGASLLVKGRARARRPATGRAE
jgi:glucokinase